MGLRETVQKGAVDAFKAVGNILETCNYKQQGTPSYTPGSGVTVPFTEQAGLKFLFEDYTIEEMGDGKIPEEAVKASIPALNFTGRPVRDSQIIRSNPDFVPLWKVEDVGIDPAGALWILMLVPDSRAEFT